MREINTERLGAVTPAVFHMLVALADGPLHGYAIMKSVSRTAGPEFPAGASTIYGSLRRMEARGLVEETRQPSGGAADKRRRLYVLTARGQHALELEAARLISAVNMLRTRGLVPHLAKPTRPGEAKR